MAGVLFPVVTASAANLNVPLACEPQVLDLLGKIDAPLEWRRIPSPTQSQSELFIFESAAEDPRVHLRLVTRQAETQIEKSIESVGGGGSESVLSYHFATAKKCVPEIAVSARSNSHKSQDVATGSFTENDLESALKKSREAKTTLLFYIWSPHMVLSIDGVTEIAKLAQAKNYQLVVLAEPLSQSESVLRLQRQKKWPATYARRLRAEGLINQNALIHFPALLVVQRGQFVGHVRPGYDEPQRLEKYLAKVTGANVEK